MVEEKWFNGNSKWKRKSFDSNNLKHIDSLERHFASIWNHREKMTNKWYIVYKIIIYHKDGTIVVIFGRCTHDTVVKKNSITFINLFFWFLFLLVFISLSMIEGNICSIISLHWVRVQCSTRWTEYGADSNFKSRIKHWTGWSIPIQVNMIAKQNHNGIYRRARRHTPKAIESIRKKTAFE